MESTSQYENRKAPEATPTRLSVIGSGLFALAIGAFGAYAIFFMPGFSILIGGAINWPGVIIAVACFGLAMYLAYRAVMGARKAWPLDNDGQVVQANVLDRWVEVRRSSKGSTTRIYWLLLHYRVNMQEYAIRQRVSRRVHNDMGTVANVRYLPEDPQNARMEKE